MTQLKLIATSETEPARDTRTASEIPDCPTCGEYTEHPRVRLMSAVDCVAPARNSAAAPHFTSAGAVPLVSHSASW